MIDIAEQICLAVDEIVVKRLENIKYDTTIIGTIVDNSEAESYRYVCSNGSSTFVAYGQDTTYKNGDSVQITIPNGDYDQQKIIIGKYVSQENETPYSYASPFDTMIDISTNLINNGENISASLLANDNMEQDTKEFDVEIPLWTSAFSTPQAGYDRLGLQGQFRSWLADFKPKAGDYGYRLEVFSEGAVSINEEKVSITDWITLYNQVLKGEEVGSPAIIDNTPDEWYQKIKYNDGTLTKDNFKSLFNTKDNRVNLVRLMLYTNAQTSILKLERQDMYGNPFNFQDYFEQEVVFDISNVDAIVGMSLFFYETSRSFINEGNELVPYKDEMGGKLPDNLFTKAPYVCLGYDLANFDKEQAILYTLDSQGYRYDNEPTESEELNRKTVRLRWIHKFENGDIKVINESSDITDYEIRWYRYKLGSPSADEYSGVYWVRVDSTMEKLPNEEEKVEVEGEESELKQFKTNEFFYTFIPNYQLASEQIKAIVLYNGSIVRSNIITFDNEREVPNGSTAELLAGLSIWCEDNTYGNYYLYGQNNDLLRSDEGNKIRSLVAKFADQDTLTSSADVDKDAVELTEGQKIVWEFPLKNTMLIVDGFDYGYATNENAIYIEGTNQIDYEAIKENDPEGNIYKLSGYYGEDDPAIIEVNGSTIKIIRNAVDNSIQPRQKYRIEKTYAATKLNNAVKCSADKNGYTYSAQKEFSFGIMGTNGTDATLVIDFNNNVTALTADVQEAAVKVTARLYDMNHNEVDFYNTSLGLTCEWEWKYLLPSSTNDEGKLEGEIAITQNANEAQNICYLEHKGLSNHLNEYFAVLQATVKGYGDYPLTAYKAIPVRASEKYRYIVGPTEIIYNSMGYIDYYKGPYELYYYDDNNTTDDTEDNTTTGIALINSEWKIHNPYEEETNSEEGGKYIGTISKENILRPTSIYFEDVDPYGAIGYDGNEIAWVQPLVIMRNNYPSSTLNRWDGNSIEINEKEGYIVAPAIAAGKKHDDNTFSGVMIGDWADKDEEYGGTAEEITKHTGLYGFHHGAISYAFQDDGKAFIGKDGTGRINLDGEEATIYSSTYEADAGGMMIDLGGKDGVPYIHMVGGTTFETDDNENGEEGSDTETEGEESKDKVTVKARAPFIQLDADKTSVILEAKPGKSKLEFTEHITEEDKYDIDSSVLITSNTDNPRIEITGSKTLPAANENEEPTVITSNSIVLSGKPGNSKLEFIDVNEQGNNSGVLISGKINNPKIVIGNNLILENEDGSTSDETATELTEYSNIELSAKPGESKLEFKNQQTEEGNIFNSELLISSDVENPRIEIMGTKTEGEGTDPTASSKIKLSAKSGESKLEFKNQRTIVNDQTETSSILIDGGEEPGIRIESEVIQDNKTVSSNEIILTTKNSASYLDFDNDIGQIRIDSGTNGHPYIKIENKVAEGDTASSSNKIMLSAEGNASYLEFKNNTGQIRIDSGTKGNPYIEIKDIADSEENITSKILLKAEPGGSEIYFKGSGGAITISSSESDDPLTIGSNFSVGWDGSLEATNAILSGEITSQQGVIGGWYITENTLQNAENTENATIILDSSKSAICGGILKPLNDDYSMELHGSLTIKDNDGDSVTGGTNYLGYIPSGMPQYEGVTADEDGIGMLIQGVGVMKVTGQNVGLNYYPGDSYLSLHANGITIQAGANTKNKYLNLYGANIICDSERFQIKNIPAEKQEGIYARFA